MKVVLDAGPLIHLSWVDSLHLLSALFENIFLPPAVLAEVLAPPPETLGLDAIRQELGRGVWTVRKPAIPNSPQSIPAGSLGPGEVEAIYLAEDVTADLLITDNGAAKSVAIRRGLSVTGTLGVLRAAREQGLITSVLPLLLELRRLGQWFSEELVESVRREESSGGS